MIVGAIIVSVFGFQYLYSKRMVDLYHSTPISRKKLFLAGYLNGFLFWFVPCILGNIASLLVMFAKIGDAFYFGKLFVTMAQVQLLCVLSFLMVYHVCLIAVFLCGNIFNTLVNIAFLGFIFIAVYGMYYIYASDYFYSFNRLTPSLYQIGWLSPFATPFILWGMRNEDLSWLDSPILIIGSILLLLINFFIAYKLYRKRPSELAERGTPKNLYALLSKIVISVLAGMLSAWFMSELSNNESGGLFWGIFSAIVASFLVFGLMDIIHQVNFKAFWSHKLLLLLVPICTCVLFVSFEADIWPYDSYIANSSNISQASVRLYNFGDGSSNYLDENGEVINYDYTKEAEPIHLMNPETIHALLVDGVQHTTSWGHSFNIQVFRKFGGSYYRSYQLSREGYELLKSTIESDEFLHEYYPASCGDFPLPDYIQVASDLAVDQKYAYVYDA
ncbi:MAG: hypothetical protein J6033_02000, partial [Lachnospiraceae bacterium]|nr:hypothetical protein [Lachnospiraceae bacterium]